MYRHSSVMEIRRFSHLPPGRCSGCNRPITLPAAKLLAQPTFDGLALGAESGQGPVSAECQFDIPSALPD